PPPAGGTLCFAVRRRSAQPRRDSHSGGAVTLTERQSPVVSRRRAHSTALRRRGDLPRRVACAAAVGGTQPAVAPPRARGARRSGLRQALGRLKKERRPVRAPPTGTRVG